MFRRVLFYVGVGSLVIVPLGATSQPAGAVLEECNGGNCVWDQEDFNGKILRVSETCANYAIKSAYNDSGNGNDALYIYEAADCKGRSFPIRVGGQVPKISGASAKVDLTPEHR
jgi:hypothetical protein